MQMFVLHVAFMRMFVVRKPFVDFCAGRARRRFDRVRLELFSLRRLAAVRMAKIVMCKICKIAM
jgi:hypothetical protein